MSHMGQPTGRYTLPEGGSRLEFARGPMGRQTYMIDLDRAGRVTGSQQVLTDANFATIVAGMSRDNLLRTLGRPAERRHFGWPRPMDLWSYRYAAPFSSCLWFQVSLTPDDGVREASYGIDPSCDPGGRMHDSH